MGHVTYEVVEHDGGWPYKVNGVYSEAFPSHAAAHKAAAEAAARQQSSGSDASIEYEDSKGEWHTEFSKGGDRHETSVEDDA